jgi:hypothetical protein
MQTPFLRQSPIFRHFGRSAKALAGASSLWHVAAAG